MFAAWHGLPAQFIFTTFDVSHRKSRHSRTLVNAAGAAGLPSRAIDDPFEALTIARRIAGARSFGSLIGPSACRPMP